jgi:hypothetical protein
VYQLALCDSIRGFTSIYLQSALKLDLIEMTIPGKPDSKYQKYRIPNYKPACADPHGDVATKGRLPDATGLERNDAVKQHVIVTIGHRIRGPVPAGLQPVSSA